MSYIPYPSAASRCTTTQTSGDARGDAFGEYATYRRVIRTVLCGVLFATPLCAAAPMSPLLKLSQTQENKKSIIPRMMSDFFYVNFLASTAAYWVLVEPFIPNPRAKEGFVPYLGPVTAEIPAVSCLFVSHLFYPGLWAIVNEPTWKLRRREFVRLNAKCFVAFGPVHVPAAVGLGMAVGVVLYPFKYMKLRAQRRDERQHAS
ncbi:hypothetical protein conserved [Leishmania donovani]|uniref:Uncharacterized protein n=3 Tax=Leishmania donovani species complex TaxID=38574 RepID=A4I5S7_LEIIN|nr:conserved hypothetical protein [Leishmania infantum JPCM5]XP_003862962.1 hypothetical protein, conserved [Leishmania donovani]CAC9514832.1 hypothetical_protein_-_conserved [Leishmania infantum]AYU81052.1 hypothetical protein LdCL_300030800 [Leishmania donovani]TPP43279.1 hypothetical protein CGC20_6565 [Leishmania donovani]TPP45807.1 hypothetical protein CGC21_35990 [Leishmania donovani]CAJ1991044.1 hypothetical protein conserved [Leishmania donovani]|eukprot:XP_001467096.1 conserved hypothetical protein [Leishmania infantum JPCM5]